MNVRIRGWRLTVAYRRRHAAISLWHHDELRAGVGGFQIERKRFHVFADWRDRSWAYHSGIGWMR